MRTSDRLSSIEGAVAVTALQSPSFESRGPRVPSGRAAYSRLYFSALLRIERFYQYVWFRLDRYGAHSSAIRARPEWLSAGDFRVPNLYALLLEISLGTGSIEC